MRTHLQTSSLVTSLLVSLATACEPAPEEGFGDPPEGIGQVQQAVNAVGDWTGWEPGQCVHGVYAFYSDRFGVDLLGTCAQAGNLGNCQNCGACMIWESETIWPDPDLFNRYEWGSTMVQTYDIIVYPAAGGGFGYGHVACVDHSESDDPADNSKVYVMDSNWTGYEQVAPEVHTVNRTPYGFYRLKSLDTCDRTAGAFTFSCDGPQSGLDCAQVDVPGDPDSWTDNYICNSHALGLRWSNSGPIDGMDCTQVTETAGSTPSAWTESFVCAPKQLPFALSWSSAGPLEGQSCVQWNEPAAQSFNDNYLCSTNVFEFSSGAFSFKSDGPIDGKTCVLIDEPADPDTWSDNYFCSDVDIGLAWSNAGPIAGMRCTAVTEPGDLEADAWNDDFICVPEESEEIFTWSSAGPLAGKDCVRWFDHAEGESWWDNWLCRDLPPEPEPGPETSGGSGPGTGGSSEDGDSDGNGKDGDGCSASRSTKARGSAALAILACAALISRRRRAL